VTRTWWLPLAAASVGGGILLGTRVQVDGAAAVLLVVGGLAAVGAGATRGRGRAERSRGLVDRAGLAPPPGPQGPRDRVLAAAGLPATAAGGEPPQSGRSLGRCAVILLGLAVGGLGWSGLRSVGPEDLGPAAGRFVTFSGSAASDVRLLDTGWAMEAGVYAVTLESRSVPLDVRVWVSGDGPPPQLEAGQPLSGAGTLEPLVTGGSGFEDYLRARGIAGTVRVTRLRPLGPPPNPAMRLANQARAILRRGAFQAMPARQAALLLGLSIGDTSRMDAEVEEDFRATGLTHLLAVSGSNVAMFLAPVLALAGLMRARLTARVLVGAAAVAFFALLTRWEPSVLRASAMAAIALVGVWAGRPRSTAAALGGAVLILLAVDPGLAASAGFQLSVAATAGLAAMAGPLASRLRWLPRSLAVAAAATVSAQLAVTPLLLLHFGVVPSVTLLANLLAFPAVGPALLAGLAASVAGAAWTSVGVLGGRLAGLPLGYLIGVSDRLARWPLPSLAGSGPFPASLTALLAVLAAVRLRRGRRPVGLLVAAVAIAVLAWGTAPRAGPPETLTVTFLDVGQGDAAVVKTPDGATVLIDAGPDDHQVSADLASLGVRRLDLAVASHAHADHIEGFPAVLARFPVALLIEPGCPADSPSYRRFLEALADEEVPVRHPRGGQVLSLGRLRVEVLGPDRCSPGGIEPNDDSLVLRLTFGAQTILFPGDAEVPAQRDLLADGDAVRAMVLKVPHHGGDTSDRSFFDAVEAVVAVVSSGPNLYGHPDAGVLESLRAEGMVVYRTDLEGDVTVRFRPGGVVVESAGR
jgi:competence protein ComEC